MKIRPLHDRVIVDVENETPSTIIVTPDVAARKGNRGRVVAVGQEADHCRPGDRVLLSHHAGQVINHDGTEMVLCERREILAVLT